MVRSHLAATLAVGLAGLGFGALAGCGGSHPSAAQEAGAAAVAARQIPQGITITHTEPGPAHPVGTLMPRLHTAAAAKRECGYFRSGLNVVMYGGIPGDYDSIAAHFARRRAARDAYAAVKHGCRAGLRG